MVVGQNNMLEQGILEHPHFRAALAAEGIAEVFIAPPFDNVFKFDQGAGERFDAMLRALATDSGYDELATAPVVPIGHSACASYPWNFAAWKPQRTLAVLSVKGDAPETNLTGSGKPNPAWGDRNIAGVPGLMVMSEYEWWDARLEPALAFRAAHPKAPIALLADVGHCHFDAFESLVDFLALFVRKAAAARLPGPTLNAHPSTLEALRPVDPAGGWLVDRWRGDAPMRAPPAPYASYTGNRTEAFWCFDAEMARATENYYEASRGKQRQQVDFVQDGKLVPISTAHFGVQLAPKFDADGVAFHLDAAFIRPLPPRLPIAAKDKPPPVTSVTPEFAADGTHAAGPVTISRITGPVEKNGTNTFRIALGRALARDNPWANDIWLIASNPGDATYKGAVQQAVLKLPHHTVGADQHIAFAPMVDQKLGTASVTLHATSDAGLPVSFFVREGPVELNGDTLRLTAIPPRAKLPIRVTVVAWQFGRDAEPKVKAAEQVVRSFEIRP